MNSHLGIPTGQLDQQSPAQSKNLQDRRNDYDVTNTVQVSSPAAVRDAVQKLFAECYPGASFDRLWLAFYDFERLFTGRYPGYYGCDTTYHDMQHSLDMTLAMARLIVGYERSSGPSERIGARRAQMAIITSLFHDAGYIRHAERDAEFQNGAEFTLYHVSRSADFLRRYLPDIGMAREVGVASMIVHFTGYELDIDSIELDDPPDASFLMVYSFRCNRDPFGIMAPVAGQRATLKKNGRANPRPIVNGIFFYIKNDAGRHNKSPTTKKVS